MGKNRKRKRVRDKALKEGIPVAKLGAEFEWIDERLKVGLEAYPTFKRPLGKAEMAMVLSLGLYYNDITKKWEPLSAIDISTVRNQARFYYTPPAELSSDQWADLRINNEQYLMTYPVPYSEAQTVNIRTVQMIAGTAFNETFFKSIKGYTGLELEIFTVGAGTISVYAYRVIHGLGEVVEFQQLAIGAPVQITQSLTRWSEYRILIDGGPVGIADFQLELW